MSRRNKIRFTIILTLVLSIYLGTCSYLWAKQRHFIFEPTRDITKTPADYHLLFKDVYIPVSSPTSGTKDKKSTIHGWWIPAEKNDAKAVLYLHGSAFNVSANVDHAYRLNKIGFSVLLIDYRGYGLSDGKFPSEDTVYEDAEAAWGYLINEQGFRSEDIVTYGHSLGGAVGIHLALHHPDAAGLIVESTFTSIVDVAVNRATYRLFPLNWIVNQKFDSIAKINRLRTPVLFIHGVKDEAVPTNMTRQLYENTRAPKRLLLVPDGTHNNNAGMDERRYIDAVTEFLEYAMKNLSVDT